jgi:hypothetical protein
VAVRFGIKRNSRLPPLFDGEVKVTSLIGLVTECLDLRDGGGLGSTLCWLVSHLTVIHIEKRWIRIWLIVRRPYTRDTRRGENSVGAMRGGVPVERNCRQLMRAVREKVTPHELLPNRLRRSLRRSRRRRRYGRVLVILLHVGEHVIWSQWNSIAGPAWLRRRNWHKRRKVVKPRLG